MTHEILVEPCAILNPLDHLLVVFVPAVNRAIKRATLLPAIARGTHERTQTVIGFALSRPLLMENWAHRVAHVA